MRAAPHPEQAERLRTLYSYDILDTPQEQDFDDIVALASAICEAPISVVNIIDETRQWFKAEVGLGVRETPLETSICSHVILQDDFVEIPDTLADPRMADNPLCLDDPGLRFYAGARLVAHDGMPLGTLCVLDNRPRTLNDFQRKALRILSVQVMKQLELRRALRSAHDLRAEMDHRIKNSLQSTSSLIRLYTRAVEDDKARQALEAVSRRIDGMSALHEQLQDTGAAGSVDMQRYLEDLTTSLRLTAPDTLKVSLQVDEITLPFKFATDLGMILSEFVANSIKYGYPNGAEGTVTIALTRQADDTLLLEASDQGLGTAAAAPEPDKVSGIGSRIVAAAASNLGGTLTNTITDAGAQLSLTFRPA